MVDWTFLVPPVVDQKLLILLLVKVAVASTRNQRGTP